VPTSGLTETALICAYCGPAWPVACVAERGDLMGRKSQFALGVAGLAAISFGGWLLWYFAIRPHHPSSYSIFQIAILPMILFVIGILCLLTAASAFTDTRLRTTR